METRTDKEPDRAAIPIQNVYYLLCYAWKRWEEGQSVDVSGVDSLGLADLFATVLTQGTRRLIKRGLDRGYRPVSEDTSRLRGRIDFGTSIKRTLLPAAKAHCHYDEFSPDVLHNQILKSTLRKLSYARGVHPDHRSNLIRLYRGMGGVSDVAVSRLTFRRLQLHSNNSFYRFLMSVCELVQTNLLVNESDGSFRFRDFLRDKAQMWQVFEDFVVNFYKEEQSAFSVAHHQQITWHMSDGESTASAQLPAMYPDAVLRSAERVIIADMKFYKEPFQTYRGIERFRSAHLYQLFAYLKNAELKGGTFERAEGLLIYPVVNDQFDYSWELPGHRMRVYGLDLDQPWARIHRQLLSLLKPAGHAASPEAGF